MTATDSSTGTGAPFTGTRAYSLTVGAATISLPATTLSAGTSGAAYSATLNAATGGTSPYTYAVTSGALPRRGVTLSTAGALSGSPTATGSFNFTVTATDSSTGTGAPFTGTRAYSLTIGLRNGDGHASLPFPAPRRARRIVETLGASGGLSLLRSAITTGALPSGLSLSGAGVLSGTPTANRTFNFTVTATDATSGTAATGNRAYALVVNLRRADRQRGQRHRGGQQQRQSR
ncbi:putative Ig domain-containing protein [Caulobacter segnis]